MFLYVNSMPGSRVSRIFMIFGGFGEFGLVIGNLEKSWFLKNFEKFGFGADLDHVRRLRHRSGGKS